MALRSASSRKREYIPRTAADVKAKAEQRVGAEWDSIFVKGIDTFKPRLGDNCIRILEPTWEPDPDEISHYGKNVWIHAFVGTENGSYVCLKKMKNENCPICEAAAEAKASADDEHAKKLFPKRRVLIWILNRDADDPNIPQLYSISPTMDRDIAALCTDPRTGKVLLIDHPECGYDIYFKGTQESFSGRKYIEPSAYQIAREESPITDDDKTIDKIRDFIFENPIPSILNYQTPEYLERIISGTSEARDEDLDDDDKPEPRGSRVGSDRGKPTEQDAEERASKRGGEEAKGEDKEISSPRRRFRQVDPEDDDDSKESDEDSDTENGDEDEEDTPPFDEEEKAPVRSMRRQQRQSDPEDEEEQVTSRAAKRRR